MEASSEEAEREGGGELEGQSTRRKKKEEGLRVELFVLLTSMLFLQKASTQGNFPSPSRKVQCTLHQPFSLLPTKKILEKLEVKSNSFFSPFSSTSGPANCCGWSQFKFPFFPPLRCNNCSSSSSLPPLPSNGRIRYASSPKKPLRSSLYTACGKREKKSVPDLKADSFGKGE